MNSDMQQLWTEFLADLATPAFTWQVGIIIAGLLFAWSMNGALRAYVMRNAPETWKVGIGGINRVLFPLTSLIFIYVSELILKHWQHTSMLLIAMNLLVAMAVIRLVVYALRYVFSPSAWVSTMENAISSTVWLVLALHVSGILPEILHTLEDVSFNIGKSKMNLLLLIQGLLTVLITLFIALWLSRWLENRLMRAQQINMNVRVVLSKLIRIGLSFIAILMALSAVGLDITLLSVFGGALGVGLGFGLQKIASNYVSGFIILLDRSMHMGDVITVDAHYGVVSEMRSRYMVLRKLDGTQVVIPNETLITSAVINHSYSERKAQVKMPLQVSYESPLERAMEIMQHAAMAQDRVMQDPLPDVKIAGFGESGIDLTLTFWIPDPEEGSGRLQSDIYLDIWRAFQKNSISIPYPQREVRILNAGTPTMPAAQG
ncbi:mechanosensitive ion channel-like protein [Methylovorus glucosotrophus]|uniref:mechanosensitive ion channel family protein n=1 Tax=Methylovorus glucosotrophus TaxID=266009 RepID=UPI0013318C3D|nr:mechanosensitive ion channel-like protein [Methylovorus glucosotrophus]